MSEKSNHLADADQADSRFNQLIGRRDFLKGVLVAGATVAVAPRKLFGAEVDNYSDAQIIKLTDFAYSHGLTSEEDVRLLVRFIHTVDASIEGVCREWKNLPTHQLRKIIRFEIEGPGDYFKDDAGFAADRATPIKSIEPIE